MRELTELRAELDRIDEELVRLFVRRMSVSRQVAACKLEKGLPVLDASRERQVLDSRAAMAGDPDLEEPVRSLFREIMSLSRDAQTRWMDRRQA